MARFLLKCALFSIPVLGIFIFPLAVFILGRELLPVSAIVSRQQQNPGQDILYQSAFTSYTEKPYKLLSTIARNPQIVALGLSQSLTFRARFFRREDAFYNAGRGVYSAADLSHYLNALPHDNNLAVILFDATNLLYDAAVQDEHQQASASDMLRAFLSSGWRAAYLDYAAGKFSVRGLMRERKTTESIGLVALMHHAGFRADGSLSRGTLPEILDMRKNALPMALQVADNIPEIDKFSAVSLRNLAEVKKFLALARERNIVVIGYFSPYALEIYRAIWSLRDLHGEEFRAAPATLAALFERYQYHFHDLRNLETIGSSDAELYDAGHLTEKGTLRLLLYLTAREPALAPYADIAELKKQILKEPF
ncbi:MAG: hypothetical protein HY007_02870 [Candidatus Sungbacteria bacterium]|nr:hypothetical protein [Candidatus Sungbacteria bacterium]